LVRLLGPGKREFKRQLFSPGYSPTPTKSDIDTEGRKAKKIKGKEKK